MPPAPSISPPGPRRPHRAALALLAALLAGLPTAAAAEPGRRASAAALEAARRFLCPHGGTPVSGPRGRGRCRPGAGGGGWVGSDPDVIGWDRGLPPAAHRQAPCPPGTEPVAPLAWQNAVRCLPR